VDASNANFLEDLPERGTFCAQVAKRRIRRSDTPDMRPFRIEFHAMELRVIVTALFTYAELMQALTEKEREAALVELARKLTDEERDKPEFTAWMVSIAVQLSERLQKDLPQI
jgi:hypothetical protein